MPGDAEDQPRWRTSVRIALTLASTGAGAALALLASGVNGRLGAGPFALSLNDSRNPLVWGSATALCLLILEWNRPRWRRFAVTVLVVLGLLAVVDFARRAAPIITDSDLAVGELYVEMATQGELLVGPYSRFGWHHPGPVFFYLQAPFYALARRQAAAIYAVAVAINLTAILTLGWVVARERHRWPLAVLLTGACVLFAWRVPMFLASPWTAHVPVLPSLAFLVLAAAVASGRLALVPLAALVASFVAETHVGFVPVVGAVAAGVLTFCYFEPACDRRLLRSTLNRSAWLCTALWILPVSEALAHAGGNLASLLRFFVTDVAPGHSLREAFINWSYGMTGILRPDFMLPWGGHFELTHLWWSVPCAIGELLGLAVIARLDLGAGRRFEGCLATVALGASVVSLWSLTRIRGDILSHDLFRIAALGALNLGIIGAAGLRVLVDADRKTWSRRVSAPVAAYLVLGGLALALGERDLRDLTAYERRRTERVAIVNAYTAIRNYIAAEGIRRPLFRLDEDRWGDAAGILLRLRQDDTPVSVENDRLPMFTDAFAATGDEDVVITLANLGLHTELRARPDTVVIVESGPFFVDATKITPNRHR